MNNNKKLYLCIPYSDDDPVVRQFRFEIATQITAKLFRRGFVVFSPITYSHVLAEKHNLATDHKTWKALNDSMMEWADEIVVAKVWGWDKSLGIADEMAVASKLPRPVWHLEHSELIDEYGCSPMLVGFHG